MVAGLIIAMLGLGIRYSYGVFLTSFETEFAFNRSSVSGIFSFYMLACCIVAIAGGWALDRFGPRPVGLSMALFCFAGFFITSIAQNRWNLLWAYGLFLSLGTGPIYTVVNSTVSRWFVKRRGLALGITSSGGGAGAIVVPPIATYLILQNGWRSASFEKSRPQKASREMVPGPGKMTPEAMKYQTGRG